MVIRKFLPIFFTLTVISHQAADARHDVPYRGYKVYEVKALRSSDLEFLQSLEDVDGYDFWTRLKQNGTKIMIAPQQQAVFEDALEDANIEHRIVIDDVGQVLKASAASQQPSRRSFNYADGTFDYEHFPRFEEILNFMERLVENRLYSEIIKIGTSFEGRPLLALRVRKYESNPVFLVDAGIHAREWASPVTAMYLMQKVVENEEIFAEKMTFYIVPVVNPDGYEYTHTTERLWRKSRSSGRYVQCKGVDLNRNFDSHWGEYGVSKKPCSGTFPGPSPFSEPESIALRDLILNTRPVIYLTLHSYGPLLLYPYGFTRDLPPNWEDLERIGKLAINKLKRINGQDYVIGSSTRVLYAASGGSDDFAMEKAGVPLVYTMELPDYGSTFTMPPHKIKPMVRETYEAFKSMVKSSCQMYCQ